MASQKLALRSIAKCCRISPFMSLRLSKQLLRRLKPRYRRNVFDVMAGLVPRLPGQMEKTSDGMASLMHWQKTGHACRIQTSPLPLAGEVDIRAYARMSGEGRSCQTRGLDYVRKPPSPQPSPASGR